MKNKLTNREYLGSYLTGLFEAVGNIYIPKNKTPKLTFSFHHTNKPLAEIIKERLGIGTIYEKKTSTTYEIFNREGVLKFIKLTNKYYRTPKINKFNEMIEYLNKTNYYNLNLSIAKLDNSSFENNAWLSGYLETNGCFSIYIKELDEKYNYIEFEQTFTISHKKKDIKNNIYELFLRELAKYLNDTPHLSTRKTYDREIYVIYLKKQGLAKLLKYISEFNFFGKRYIDYTIFKNVFDLDINIGNKLHKSVTPKDYMETIINSEKELNIITHNLEELKKQAEKLPSFDDKDSKD